jgi:hypothetical protein
MKKVYCIFVVLAIIISLCGCGNDKVDVITEYKIVYGKYTSIVEGVFNKELKETLEITYIDKNGDYKTDSIDPEYRIDFGKENKVIFTNEESFWGYKDYVLTKEAYNKIVSSSPMIIDLESEE